MSKQDIIVVGGGLAGLSFAILCADSGLKVLLLEKGAYPRQKVCGEYISMESYDFVKNLGVPLDAMQVPKISRFVLTSPHGKPASTSLGTGGFGISRYTLDEQLYQIALQKGVSIKTQCKVTQIEKISASYQVKTQHGECFQADWVVGAYGRISGLDNTSPKSSNEFVGIKYHVDVGPDEDTIEIHNFKGGYCGISMVDKGVFNLCYLAKAADFKACKGDVEVFENTFLKQNPYLAERLKARKVFDPVITSKISFGVNNPIAQGHLQIGDAAGFIPPLTGNGMSLAFRSAKVLHQQFMDYLEHKNEKILLNSNQAYVREYLHNRIKKGVYLQNLLFFTNKHFNKLLFLGLTHIPGMMGYMTKQAVGEKI